MKKAKTNHPIAGVGIVIFRGNQLRVITEFGSKPEAKKVKGAISIPVETPNSKEVLLATSGDKMAAYKMTAVRAANEEGNLRVKIEDLTEVGEFRVNGTNIWGLIFMTEKFSPASKRRHNRHSPRWISTNDLLRLDPEKVRPPMLTVIKAAIRKRSRQARAGGLFFLVLDF